MGLSHRSFRFPVLFTSLFLSSILFARGAVITRRVMTDEELERLREVEGVYEEGRNYNVLVDGHGTGLRPPTTEEWDEMRRMAVMVDEIRFAEKQDPPLHHDNSASDWFPPIGNQDGEGSCVSWACGYYMKTFQEALEHGWDLSGCNWVGGFYGHPTTSYQDQIFSPDFIYHQVNAGLDEGSNYSDNMNLLKRIGCASWEKMPYDPLNSTRWPDEDAWREAPWYRSETGHTIMMVESDAAIENLKEWLADSNLAVISINAGYYSYLTSEDLWTYDNYNPPDRNHANTILGYDDSLGPYLEDGDPNTYGAFKVANSWGKGGWENVYDGFLYISYRCMKQRVNNVRIYENKIGYEPELISVFELSHPRRNECQITAGIGTTGSPYDTKRFENYGKRGGGHPFPSNPMVMDITEFVPHMSGPPDNFFLKVYDGGTDSTGTIDSFSIEKYDDYASGVPLRTYVSTDPPVNTVNSSHVYAQVATDARDSLWIVGGGAAPGELAIVEVWLMYKGGGPGDSISSFDVPLTWDASVCTVETLTIGPDFSDWTNVSLVDNEGTQGPPPIPKLALSAFTFGPPYPPQLPQGIYLAGTVYFRILDTTLPPESTSVDTLMEAFSPPVYLGFADKNGENVYIPLFSRDYVQVEGLLCGDCNGDERVTVADATYLVSFIYREGPEPLGSGDVNLDGRTTIADATYIVAYVYRGGPAPCAPPRGRILGHGGQQ